MPKKTPIENNVQSSFKSLLYNPAFYTGVLAVVVILAIVLTSSFKNKNNDTQNGTTSTDQRVGQQTISVSITDPNNISGWKDTQAKTQQTAQVLYSTETQDSTHSLNFAGTGGVENFGGKVVYKIDKFKKLATQPLKFDIFDANGQLMTPDYLKTNQEQKVHLFIVGKDLKSYMHLNPRFEDGKWQVNADLLKPGTYYSFANFTTVNGVDMSIKNKLVVQNETSDAKLPGLTPELKAIVGSYQLLAKVDPLVATSNNKLTLSVSENGKPAFIQPFMGTFGYLALFKQEEDLKMINVVPTEGIDGKSGTVSHIAEVKTLGRYTAFAEFRIKDKLIVFPFTFDLN